MRVNVITVVKDDLDGFRRTSRSIIQQNIQVHWIVVTPSGNLDISEYIESLKLDGVVEAVIQDAGLGVYPAMNEAIEWCAEEDWVWFLNAGDTFADKDSYSKVVSAIAVTTKNWVYGGHFLASDSGVIITEMPAPKQFKLSNQLFSRKYISHQSAIFNAQFLQRLKGFNTHFKIAADWDLMARASQICMGDRIPATLSVFYLGGLSTYSRQIGNQELLRIRRIQLSKKYIIKSYLWFFYRMGRNFIVQKLENINPEMVNSIRRFHFLIRKKVRKKID
jgi:hypothetical protein